MKRWDAFQIKLLMAALMMLDHLNIVPGLVPPAAVGPIHLLTRCVGAWFAFMAVEGFLHTRDRIRYNARLFLWAALMGAGNRILNLCYRPAGVAIYNNIFLTLAFGVLVLNLLFHRPDRGKMPVGMEDAAGEVRKAAAKSGSKAESKAGGNAAALAGRIALALAAMAVGMVCTEGGAVLLPLVVITYLSRANVRARDICYLAFAGFLLIESFVWYPGDMAATVGMLLINSDWAFPLAIPFLHLYSGEKGRGGLGAKYFFYLFYPAHLWFLATIAFWVSK